MASPERPSKRTRQACEPCRRKKSRCPGERPICSHCARLGQDCAYASEEDPNLRRGSRVQRAVPSSPAHPERSGDRSTVDRLAALEARMQEMQRTMKSQHSTGHPRGVVETSNSQTLTISHISPFHSPRTAISQSRPEELSGRATPHDKLPPWDFIVSVAQLYLKYCNYQPLPLFPHDILIPSLSAREPELLLAILALGSRFLSDSPESSATERAQMITDFSTSARHMIMHRVFHGPVELSTIQALCILSLVEFNSGNSPRASTYSSLAMDLSLSAGLSSEVVRSRSQPVYEERRRCYWSVVLLKNLYGFPAGSFLFAQDDKTPRVPQSPDPPIGASSLMTDAALEQPETGMNSTNETSDLGIVAYAIQLSEVWQKASRFAHRRGKAGPLPAWSAQSEYSQITAELMELETRLPYKYRFRPARFEEQEGQQLQRNRDFWASWVLLQMIYHGILCLLNHPLLLSLRLRNFRMTMVPEIFLQHTADLTATHTEWIIHLLDLTKRKEFELSDPFLAQCAAIAATIYLQQSYSDDPTIRSTKQEYFRKCVSFIKMLGPFWPHIDRLANQIEEFERVVSASFHDSATQRAPDARVFIDLSLFWEIIESSFVGELPAAADFYFGASLTSHRQIPQTGEVLRSRLLPEPTRISHEGITGVEDTTRSAASVPGAGSLNSSQIPPAEFALDDEVSILAQSYFAQGQDFVGSLDDWWLPGQASLS